MALTEQELQEYQRRVRIGRANGGRVKSGVAGHTSEATRSNEASLSLTKAHAGSTPASSPYKSKWEAAYASKLELEKRAGLIKQYWYEPFSLWLPGKIRYKPDFMVEIYHYPSDDGRPWSKLELIEVKGWSRNRRDGMTRLKIAAALFPCFVWRLVYRTKGGLWESEHV